MANILVVDDESHMREMLQQLLELDHHHVTSATNGNDGLACFQRKRPDLIITDVIMPEKSGIDMIIDIRKIDTKTPVIAISGGQRSVYAVFNLDSSGLVGANFLLPKPFSRQQLQAAVKEVYPARAS